MGYPPKNIPPIDYGNIPIKKLPPGEAFGARDLQTWAVRRADGKCGTGSAQNRALTLECKACGGASEIIAKQIPAHKNQKRGIFDCRHCGEHAARIKRVKRLRAV